MCEVAPSNAKTGLLALAKEGSSLHKKYRIYLQMVTMASLPYNQDRLKEVLKRLFQKT